jgi:hypothetical protein
MTWGKSKGFSSQDEAGFEKGVARFQASAAK